MPELTKLDYRTPTKPTPRPTTWPEMVALVFLVAGVVMVLSMLAYGALSLVVRGFGQS